MCAATATHSTQVNNALLILVVVLNASTNVSAFQAQNKIVAKNKIIDKNPTSVGFFVGEDYSFLKDTINWSILKFSVSMISNL